MNSYDYNQRRTGNHSIYCYEYYGAGYIYIPAISTASEVWASIWVYQMNSTFKYGIYLTDNQILYLDQSGGYYRLVIGGAGVYTSPEPVVYNRWVNIAIHLKVADSPNGVYEFSVDGGPWRRFEGDTKPSSATDAKGIYFTNNQGYLDDICMSDSGPTGDIRFVMKLPVSDNTVEFLPSTGSTNYACVDEDTPSDTDYVSSGSDGDVDLYNLADSGLSDIQIPKMLSYLYRVKKENADGSQIKTILKLDANEDISDAIDLSTSFITKNEIYDLAPDGGEWTSQKIDDLLIGVVSVIP